MEDPQFPASEEPQDPSPSEHMDGILRAQYEAQKRAQLVQAAIDKLREAQAQQEAAYGYAAQRGEEIDAAASELEAVYVQTAIDWLTERWGYGRKCPYCDSDSWSVGTPFEIQLATGELLSPHFPVMCTTCGNTVFINAIWAGLVPEPEADDSESEAQ